MVMRKRAYYAAMRDEMVDDTTDFLSWALQNSWAVPRIPRLRVDSFLRFPERVKAKFWESVLSRMKSLPYRRRR
jgi:hypothetical protein